MKEKLNSDGSSRLEKFLGVRLGRGQKDIQNETKVCHDSEELNAAQEHDFRLEEYRQIRAELMERERTIGQIFTIAVVSIGAMAAALLGILTSDQRAELAQHYIFPYLMLLPLVITIPLFSVIISHRRDLLRAGAYIQTFFEEQIRGVAWQTRIGEYRKMRAGEALDTIQQFFGVTHLICTFAFVYAAYHRGLASIDPLPLMILLFISYRNRRNYEATLNTHRSECIKTWRKVRENESAATGHAAKQSE